MYDIGIPEINVTARSESEDGRAILYTAEAAHRPECCANPACGHKIKPHVHSSKSNLIHDIRSEGKLVYINLTIRRYRCPDCSYVFPDEFTFFAKNSHITDRLKQEFVDRCIKGETFTYIGSNKKDNSNKKDLKQANKQSSDLPIEKECQKFFRGISNYINGLHNMLLGIIQNEQPEKYCRLQLYNIVSSYEVYHNFCNVNNHFFKEYKCEVDKEKERITLEKMVAVTHWIYLNGSHQENNIIYNAYEVMKKKKRAIDSFFEKGIGDYPEVREHALFDDDVIVFTDWENYDLLVEKIYHKVQELAGPSELISPARAYLFNRINCVRIVLSKNSYKDYLTIRIPINSFTLAKNIEQLQQYILGAEKNYSFIPLEDLRDGAIASTILICDQAVQIEEALIVSSQYTVKESIASINKMLSAELEDVAKKIQELDECKDIYLDIKKIASLNIFTLDKVECRSNYNILEAFVSKYSS